MVNLYKTYADYGNETGFNQLAYPLRDSIMIINPFFVMLFGVFLVLTVSSYYAFINLSGKSRIFNSLLASSFVTFVISVFFAMAEWVTPLHTLTFIGITLLVYILTIFYK